MSRRHFPQPTPQFSIGADDEKQQSQTTKQHSEKGFTNKHQFVSSSNFLAPDKDNIGHQDQLHQDAERYNQKVYGKSTNKNVTNADTRTNQNKNVNDANKPLRDPSYDK